MLCVRFLATIIAHGVLDTTAEKDATLMQTARWTAPYVQTTRPLEVVLPADLRRPISDVVVLSTLTVKQEKSVRMQSVWRAAGRTQRALVGTLNASQEWRAASFVKTYNALKVVPTTQTARVLTQSVTQLTTPIALFVTITTAPEDASAT